MGLCSPAAATPTSGLPGGAAGQERVAIRNVTPASLDSGSIWTSGSQIRALSPEICSPSCGFGNHIQSWTTNQNQMEGGRGARILIRQTVLIKGRGGGVEALIRNLTNWLRNLSSKRCRESRLQQKQPRL